MHSFFRQALSAGILALLLSSPALAAEQISVSAGSYIKDLMQGMASDFRHKHPDIDVQVVVGPRSDDDLVQDLLRRSITGSNLPDIVVAGSHVRLFAERGLAVPLDPLIAKSPGSALVNATPAVLDKGRIGDKVYGVAFGLSIPVVLINADLVRKAGGDPDNLPTDWPGILELARKIDGAGAPIVGGFMEADNTGALSLLYLLQSQGGRMMDPKETLLTIDTPQGEKALGVLKGFGEAGQAKASMTRDQARQAFGAGTIGVFVTMSSTIARIEASAKDHFTVKSVPLPVVAGGGSLPTAGPIASILTKDAKRQEAALKFLEFMVSPKGQLVVTKTSGYAPVNQPAIDQSPDLQRVLAAQPNAKTVIASLPVATGWYTPPGENPARIADIVNDALFKVVTLKTTPEAALKAMEQEIAPLLPRP